MVMGHNTDDGNKEAFRRCFMPIEASGIDVGGCVFFVVSFTFCFVVCMSRLAVLVGAGDGTNDDDDGGGDNLTSASIGVDGWRPAGTVPDFVLAGPSAFTVNGPAPAVVAASEAATAMSLPPGRPLLFRRTGGWKNCRPPFLLEGEFVIGPGGDLRDVADGGDNDDDDDETFMDRSAASWSFSSESSSISMTSSSWSSLLDDGMMMLLDCDGDVCVCLRGWVLGFFEGVMFVNKECVRSVTSTPFYWVRAANLESPRLGFTRDSNHENCSTIPQYNVKS
jgi:hypothetical protein